MKINKAKGGPIQGHLLRAETQRTARLQPRAGCAKRKKRETRPVGHCREERSLPASVCVCVNSLSSTCETSFRSSLFKYSLGQCPCKALLARGITFLHSVTLVSLPSILTNFFQEKKKATVGKRRKHTLDHPRVYFNLQINMHPPVNWYN